jgi:antitoxin CcdA
MWWPQETPDVRRAVNLGASTALVADAHNAGVNLSALFERALVAELRQVRRAQWRDGNAEALAAYNEYLMLHGACFEGRLGE